MNDITITIKAQSDYSVSDSFTTKLEAFLMNDGLELLAQEKQVVELNITMNYYLRQQMKK